MLVIQYGAFLLKAQHPSREASEPPAYLVGLVLPFTRQLIALK